MTNKEIQNAYVGDTQVEKIYLGADIVWSAATPEPDYSLQYFTIEALSAGTLTIRSAVTYSINNAAWITMSEAGSISFEAGDKVRMKGSLSNSNNLLSGNSLSSNVYGNIQSLYYSDDFSAETTCKIAQNMFRGYAGLVDASNLVLPATTLANVCYLYMFYGCTNLTSAPELPATTLAVNCYGSMFRDCTGLTSAPELPATTLAVNCYGSMFEGCTNLTAAPALPATTLAGGCYNYMFRNCTSLASTPALPATTLASYCYSSMFQGCTNLTTAPALPATALASGCYGNMFQGCTNLTTAPELPATALAAYCYQYMFSGCTSLTSITCLATDISATECTSNWVNGVASTGTFVGYPGAYWTVGSNGIPQGWTFTQYYVAPTAMTIVVAAAITSSGQAKVSFEPIYGWSDSVSWTSSNTSLAQIDENGNITVVADGNITISATDNNYGLSATANVEVRKRIVDTRVVATYEGGTREILSTTDGFSKVENENGDEINLDRYYYDAPEEDYKLYFTLRDDTRLPDDCFNRMNGLLSLEIPASVQTIGDNAFGSCTQLSSITCYAETAPSYTDIRLQYMGGTFYYPAASIDSYQMMIDEFQMYDWTCTGI